MGLLALIVALSGTAYATTKIGAADIARNAVRSGHIKNGQVKGGDVAEASLARVPDADQLDGLADVVAVSQEFLATIDFVDGLVNCAGTGVALRAEHVPANNHQVVNATLTRGAYAFQHKRGGDQDVNFTVTLYCLVVTP